MEELGTAIAVRGRRGNAVVTGVSVLCVYRCVRSGCSPEFR